jgi:hypothetical protein
LGDGHAARENIGSAMAGIAIYHGRFRVAQNLYSVAQRYSHWPAASPPEEVLSHTALSDAETGNYVRARQAAEQALSAGPNSTKKRLVALILARAEPWTKQKA